MTAGPQEREEEVEGNEQSFLSFLRRFCFLIASLLSSLSSLPSLLFPSYADSVFTSSHSVVLAVFFFRFIFFLLISMLSISPRAWTGLFVVFMFNQNYMGRVKRFLILVLHIISFLFGMQKTWNRDLYLPLLCCRAI